MIQTLAYYIRKTADSLLRNTWRTFFWVFAILLALVLPLTSLVYGITWDEWETSNNGILALRNILTWGQDSALMKVNLAYLYTHFFSVIVSAVYGLLFDNIHRLARDGLQTETQILNFFNVSHFINALFGFSAALYAGLFAKKMAGWRAAFITLLFVGISPRFFGNSMNNSKDIPFAAVYIFCIYQMSFFLDSLPRVSLKPTLLTALGVGLCIGTRLGGAIVFVYLFALSFIFLLPPTLEYKINRKDWLRLIGAFSTIIILGTAICLIFWPFGRSHNPFEIAQAFAKMSDFKFWDHPLLFEGNWTLCSKLPWYYISKWILISSPFFFPAGLIFYVAFRKKNPLTTMRSILLLAMACFFPLIFILIRHTNVYDSWRHLLFVYPPLVIFAALGWDCFFRFFTSRPKQIAIGVLIVVLSLEPIVWMVRNSRNISVYFNPAVGGVHGAFTRYQSDYWGNCLKESAEWLVTYHQKNYGDFPLASVWADGTVMQTYPYLKKALGVYYQPFGYPPDFLQKNPYVLYTFGKNLSRDLPWNYALLMSRERSSEELKTSWPPPGTIHTIDVDGAPICAVIKNDQFYENLKTIWKKDLTTAPSH